jgi:branched-chain amino acid transport system substrate-binding protein
VKPKRFHATENNIFGGVKMSKKLLFLLTVLLVATMLVSVVGCGGAPAADDAAPDDDAAAGDDEIVVSEDAIVVGAIFPLTGAIATFGQSSKNAIELAVTEVNAAGGVLGKEIQVVFMDNKSTAPESALAAEKLIGEGVVAILGPVASSNSLAAGPVAQEAGIVLMSPTSTNPDVTLVGDFIFRACFLDPFQAYSAVRLAVDELGAQTAAILYDTGSDYSKGLADNFAEYFAAEGGEVVEIGEFVDTETDYSAILTRVKDKNPDVVYVPSYYGTAGLIVKQAADLGIEAVFIGADGWDSPQFVELAGDAAEGHFFTNHYTPADPKAEVQNLLAGYAAAYGGAVPDALAVLAYDAAKLLFNAIEVAGSTDSVAIRDALWATEGFEGATGTFSFDENRNPVKTLVVNTFIGGEVVLHTTIQP